MGTPATNTAWHGVTRSFDFTTGLLVGFWVLCMFYTAGLVIALGEHSGGMVCDSPRLDYIA